MSLAEIAVLYLGVCGLRQLATGPLSDRSSANT
jgi:hypothetical protein